MNAHALLAKVCLYDCLPLTGVSVRLWSGTSSPAQRKVAVDDVSYTIDVLGRDIGLDGGWDFLLLERYRLLSSYR